MLKKAIYLTLFLFLIIGGAGCGREELKNVNGLNNINDVGNNSNSTEIGGNENPCNISDPNTYQNNLYSYSINYPKKWEVKQSDDNSFLVRGNDKTLLWISIPPLGFGYDSSKEIESSWTVDGINAHRIDIDGLVLVDFKVNNNDVLVRFEYDQKDKEQCLNLFKDLVDSLKFTKGEKNGNIAEWKTDNESDFLVKIPVNWKKQYTQLGVNYGSSNEEYFSINLIQMDPKYGLISLDEALNRKILCPYIWHCNELSVKEKIITNSGQEGYKVVMTMDRPYSNGINANDINVEEAVVFDIKQKNNFSEFLILEYYSKNRNLGEDFNFFVKSFSYLK